MEWDTIVTGDCLDVLSTLPEGCAELVFADPPFNIGYNYDVYQDRRPKRDYLAWSTAWLAAVDRVLAPRGSFFLAIGDEYVAEYKVRLDLLGWTMRNWIVWHYTFGVSCQKKFTRSHAHILYYTRHPKKFTFNTDFIRVPSARMATYRDKRANPKGKLPDDTWILRPQEAEDHFRPDSDTWHIARVCGTFKERTGHPCQMPESVLDRIIRVSTNKGDHVLDPFAGSGTTLAAAKRLGRHYLGIELSADYATAARDRLQKIAPSESPATLFPQG